MTVIKRLDRRLIERRAEALLQQPHVGIGQDRSARGRQLFLADTLAAQIGRLRLRLADEQLPLVMNGCSDLMVEVFGDAGRHARTTVGVYRLPSGYAVEVDAVVEVRD